MSGDEKITDKEKEYYETYLGVNFVVPFNLFTVVQGLYCKNNGQMIVSMICLVILIGIWIFAYKKSARVREDRREKSRQEILEKYSGKEDNTIDNLKLAIGLGIAFVVTIIFGGKIR